ncbi:heparin lyase I family protein [Nocardiopsis yanglingensis]|nr:heparin lyase I family protein [Stenotrophomonas maltophilia]HEL4237938.1 heparin lyase I family protein [Stenotrophomonas maltophilia]
MPIADNRLRTIQNRLQDMNCWNENPVIVRAAILLLIATAPLSAGCVRASQASVDGIPELQREAPFSYSIKTTPSLRAAGSGNASDAGSGTTYDFDWRMADWDGTRATKGTELRTKPMPWLKEQWLSFKFFADEKYFAGDSRFSIILQYHSMPDIDLGEEWRNPVSSFVIRGRNIQYDYRSSSERVTPKDASGFIYTNKGTVQLGAVRFGQWNEVVVHQTFDYYNGHIKIWMNGKAFEQTGGIGFNDRRGLFVKFGLYCPERSDLAEKRISFRDVRMIPAKPNDPIPGTEEAAFRQLGVTRG